MLYIGNFSYNDDSDSKDNYCLMPCVVEAENADEAMEKFADHFQAIRRNSDLLDGAHEIFLDSLCELEGTPSEPVICQWQKIVPALDGLCSITSALPVVDEDNDFANAYGWGEEDDEDEHGHYDDLDDIDEDAMAESEPFLLF